MAQGRATPFILYTEPDKAQFFDGLLCALRPRRGVELLGPLACAAILNFRGFGQMPRVCTVSANELPPSR